MVIIPVFQIIDGVAYKKKLFLIFLILAVIQSSGVLWKLYKMRKVSPGLIEAVNYFKAHPWVYQYERAIFMYPEGNYRLFPSEHKWYLDYNLKDFWKTSPDGRYKMMLEYGIGAVVIKKHLIGDMDKDCSNLGIYPRYFVEELKNDSRYTNVVENKDVSVYFLKCCKVRGLTQ